MGNYLFPIFVLLSGYAGAQITLAKYQDIVTFSTQESHQNMMSQPVIKSLSEGPGGNVSFIQTDFDDSKWDMVNLPHDWEIGEPFIREGEGGMGRLPSPGTGWYG